MKGLGTRALRVPTPITERFRCQCLGASLAGSKGGRSGRCPFTIVPGGLQQGWDRPARRRALPHTASTHPATLSLSHDTPGQVAPGPTELTLVHLPTPTLSAH